jgi:hypothetical protein
MKSKPNFVFHISTSNMKTVFNIFVKKLSVVWFDYLIKEDVQNVLLLLARRPGGDGAIGQQHRRLSSDPDHPTLPTSVASDRLHHGLLSGRLALA